MMPLAGGLLLLIRMGDVNWYAVTMTSSVMAVVLLLCIPCIRVHLRLFE